MRELAKDQSRKVAIEKALQRIERQSSEPVETPKPGDTAGSEETSGGSEDNTGNLPGDSSAGVSAKLLLWFLLAFSSCSVLAGIWFYGRKEKS